MKRLLFICLSVLLLLCSCGKTNPDFQPVASVSDVEMYDDFSCTVVMDEEEIRLTGDAALQLYEKACGICADSETVISTVNDNASLALIFYTGGSDMDSDRAPHLQADAISYGQFTIWANDTARYSNHVLISHGTTFGLKKGAYEEIRALAEQLVQE